MVEFQDGCQGGKRARVILCIVYVRVVRRGRAYFCIYEGNFFVVVCQRVSVCVYFRLTVFHICLISIRSM